MTTTLLLLFIFLIYLELFVPSLPLPTSLKPFRLKSNLFYSETNQITLQNRICEANPTVFKDEIL